MECYGENVMTFFNFNFLRELPFVSIKKMKKMMVGLVISYGKLLRLSKRFFLGAVKLANSKMTFT